MATHLAIFAGLDAGLFVRWRSRKVDFVRRFSAMSFVGAVLIIPINANPTSRSNSVWSSGIVISRRISFKVLRKRSTTATLPRFPTAPNLGRMFLALH